MAQTSITADIHQPFDVHGDAAPKVTLYLVFLIDESADPADFIIGEVFDSGIRRNLCMCQDFRRDRRPYAINISESDDCSFVFWDINTRYSCHQISFLENRAFSALKRGGPALSLTLFVFWVFANDAHHTLPADHFTFNANRFYR